MRPRHSSFSFSILIGVALLFQGAATSSARTDLITFAFTGTVESVDSGLSSTFSVGQTLAGLYTFDPTTARLPSSTPTFEVFDALTNLNFSLGSYSAASTSDKEIQIDADPPSPNDDRYSVVSRASDGLDGGPVNGEPLIFLAFRLDAPSGSVFSTGAPLPTSLNLSDFTNQQTFFVEFGSGNTTEFVFGSITSLTSAPEPSSLTLLTLGIAGLAGAGWHRKRTS